jgi:hypothetical protein
MTNDEINATLQRIFPGDPVPDVMEDDDDYTPPPSSVSWRVSAPPTTVRHVESPRIKAQREPVAPETVAQFSRVMAALPPTQPSAPTRQYLIESQAHVTRWIEEAKDIESDVKLGQEVEKHQVTRLLLEAIPVVQKFSSE